MISIPIPFTTVAKNKNKLSVNFRSVGTRNNVFSPPTTAASISCKGAAIDHCQNIKSPATIKLEI
jgi:hypothetical protein